MPTTLYNSTDSAQRRLMERASDELRRGRGVVLKDGGRAVTVFAADAADVLGRLPEGDVSVVISPHRARYLGCKVADDSPVCLAVPRKDANELAELLYAERLNAEYESRPVGAVEKAALRFVRCAGLLPAALIVENYQDDEAFEISADWVLKLDPAAVFPELEAIVHLPIAENEDARLAAFRERGGLEHLALIIGEPEKDSAPVVRLHSSCMTGDILGSLRCDCGAQLKQAIHSISGAKSGVLLYLNQEGRGIGLSNKLRAYALQDAGLDTVDANLALGFAEDERDFSLAAHMLKALKISRVRLLSNNPQKAEVLSSEGIEIAELVPLVIPAGPHNEKYLATKARRMGHRLVAPKE